MTTLPPVTLAQIESRMQRALNATPIDETLLWATLGDVRRTQAMTPPPAAAALAELLERIAVDTGQHGPSMLAALAASGWQVTREGEGLLDSDAFRDAVQSVFEAPGEWGPAQGYYAKDTDHFIGMLRAALASGEEEGQ